MLLEYFTTLWDLMMRVKASMLITASPDYDDLVWHGTVTTYKWGFFRKRIQTWKGVGLDALSARMEEHVRDLRETEPSVPKLICRFFGV